MKKIIKRKLKKQIKKNSDKMGVFAILVGVFCALIINKRVANRN